METSSDLFVLDTNVIVSAILSPRSVPRQAFDRAFLLGTILVSDAILVEVDDVLRRPKFLSAKFDRQTRPMYQESESDRSFS